MSTLRESEIVFPQASRSIYAISGELKRANLSISNRLRSIQQDASFVESIAEKFQLPLIANERCGSWYIPPHNKHASAYFKSTDGHFGHWSFSLRRLNLHILKVIGEYGGCIIIDSTRRGKSMPDALSKTVPIWIAVLNALLFPERTETHRLALPADVCSQSESAQIETRLEGFLQAAYALNLNLDGLRNNLADRPMRPIWITPAGRALSSLNGDYDEHFQPIILCTASSRDSDEDRFLGYVQGAADDHEAWGLGLDPVLYWEHVTKLLHTSEDDLPNIIQDLVATCAQQYQDREPRCVLPVHQVFVGSTRGFSQQIADFDIVVSCAQEDIPDLSTKHKRDSIHLTCASGKVGSRQLRTELNKLGQIRDRIGPSTKILVLDADGRDIAVGVALALICLYFDADGKLITSDEKKPSINKVSIKHRLSWIMVSIPDASPSRATLQSVNSYLMG